MELNPFNILNVYADCSAKELAASKARLTAFTSVGKVVKDLVVSASEKKQHNVTTVQIQAAYNTLQQPSNKISYPDFVNASPKSMESDCSVKKRFYGEVLLR